MFKIEGGNKHGEELSGRRSRRIDYKASDESVMGGRFIYECGHKLKAHPVTIATAAHMYHRFMRTVESSSYDSYLVGATCLFMAGKVRDNTFKMRDVINVAHHTLHRDVPPLDLKDEYWARRDAIVQAELLLMRTLQFDVNFPTPHQYLLHYLKTLKTWLPGDTWSKVPIAQASSAFLQDIYHSPSVLDFSPQAIALGSLYLTFQCYGVDIPFVKETDETGWFTPFSKEVPKETIWNVVDTLIDLYNQHD